MVWACMLHSFICRLSAGALCWVGASLMREPGNEAMPCHVWFSAQLDPEMCSPLSLEQLSLLCIVGELEHLTIAVAVLPRHLYHNLLSSLPVADVCRLDDN